MKTKISQLKAAAAQEDWTSVLRMASKFPVLGEHKKVIMQAWEAMVRPDFQRQLGRDPQALIAEGITAIKQRYAL